MLCSKIYESWSGRGLLLVDVNYRQTNEVVMSCHLSHIVRYTNIKVIQNGAHTYAEFRYVCTYTFCVVCIGHVQAEHRH